MFREMGGMVVCREMGGMVVCMVVFWLFFKNGWHGCFLKWVACLFSLEKWVAWLFAWLFFGCFLKMGGMVVF
ncbi:hypothetical protein [Psychromonas sp. MB-3u-54]|uniref:hypothetical protein n=1 Tax=Psychromonas sp. MB-3u-54 TaxID=2058319 RepID=UPI0018E35DDA|nr:hypothetical protein [Psychromonas sp. MB-3u-54]